MLSEEQAKPLLASPERESLAAGLAEYNRLTGSHETDTAILFDHVRERYGDPCSSCGKVLRTPVAYKCAECGRQAHEPEWKFLMELRRPGHAVAEAKTVILVDMNDEGKEFPLKHLEAGNEIEIRDVKRVVATTTVSEIKCLLSKKPGRIFIGVFVPATVPASEIRPGREIWALRARNPAAS